ncbi:ATP-dependent DNA helicase RecG [Magnetovibrio blakemorei]|uniref:ATP-dependent DNA helicase RecG n=1 Tax=Magnetovibrio blakemorei TaxID=28181 RepID=A0A1E5Q715_9PROT|nr:ATP-dependent DNA helicase RecG [Magnetovibrio blakemorei]OEJ66862.1 ATP-dependent DNA helicase RecG [Magnetovibrio blakemorei]
MRPEVLYPLFKPVDTLKGVGPRLKPALERLVGGHVVDLLWHLPAAAVDRRHQCKIAEAEHGALCTLTVRISQHIKPSSPTRPYRILCEDETGTLVLTFFRAHSDYLLKTLPEGELRVVSGTVEHYSGEIQMTHPDHVVKVEDIDSVLKLEPIYPLTQGLSQKVLAKAIHGALAQTSELAEWHDPALMAKHGWSGWHESLLKAHNPQETTDIDMLAPARQRLAYDELLANQLALALVRLGMRKTKGHPTKGDGALRQKVLDALPFTLTGSQLKALGDVISDMESDHRMLRLLQGDVGSGKTVVALLAMLAAIETGAQAVMMAPTEILARQHLKTIEPLAEAAGVKVALLTGRDKGKTREALLENLKSGTIQIAVGTHALFQDDVAFQNLRLAVIDEQHRFGVHQRLELAAKGQAVDVLVMTATPIPRTLMLTAYGDMDVSRLVEKPAGRLPVKTSVMPSGKLGSVAEGISRKLDEGARVYWVCPLVEESEKLDLAAAEDRFKDLKKMFGDRVGLVHGRMKGKDKDAVMAAFKAGTIDILVATTVIEVGVDVPEATVMVIEHAERFGLAQLHQLRGRIGRGHGASSCLLVYQTPLGEVAQKRLKIMRETEDGFVIAEEDLKLRGAGEVLGTRQSGLPQFRMADLEAHKALLTTASDDAKVILNGDADLKTPRGQALRTLLYLFERDAAIKYLRSG